jgi:hypothetical protein
MEGRLNEFKIHMPVYYQIPFEESNPAKRESDFLELI